MSGPGLDDVFGAVVPVLRHVPKAARRAWAQCLARALSQVAATNSPQSWRDLLMLPKAVLRPAPRAGAQHRLQAAQFTLRRCNRWLEGERDELWEPAPCRRRPPAAHLCDEDAAQAHLEAQQARCCVLASEGELSRACAALTAPPLLDASGRTFAKLQAKHPQASPARPALLPLGPAPQAPVPEFSVADVVRAARGFSRGSAAGPTGLRGDHLREALASAHSDEVAIHLTAVVQLLARGHAPLELAAHLAGATLHALPKNNGDDVRPIAVGETLRRLVAKCLCADARAAARDWLSPLQIGVGVPLGTEAAVHTARHWVQRHAGQVDQVLLKVDFHNAFNMVDRAALLREVRLRSPGLAPGLNGATAITAGSSFMASHSTRKQEFSKETRWGLCSLP